MIKYVWSLINEVQKKYLLIIWLIMSLVSSLISVFPSIFLGKLIDTVLPRGIINEVIIWVFFIVLAIMFNSLLYIGSKSSLDLIIIDIISRLKIRIFSLFYVKKIHSILNFGTDAIYQRATQSIKTIQEKIELIARDIFGVTVSAIISVIVIMQIDILIPLLFIIIYVPYIILRGYIFKKKGYTFYEQAESASKVTAAIREIIQGIRLIKSNSQENRAISELNNLQQKNIKIQLHHVHVFSSLLLLNILMTILPEIIVYGYLGYKVHLGLNTIGNILVVAGLLGQIRNFVWQVSRYGMMLQEFKTHVERLYEIEKLPNAPYLDNKGIKKDLKGEIVFDNVTFKYSEESVLTNFNLKVPRGTSIGIVGLSGAGKTTLANLLIGVEEPKIGEILIDGIAIKEWDINSIRKQIFYVTQQPYLLNGTIRENVTYGFENVSDQAIMDALKQSELSEYINGLANKLDEIIGEHGIQLSGGQKQRLVLARAFLAKPQIIILDEATASLDLETEKNLQHALNSLCKDKTNLIIAHRLSTLRNVNLIIVLENGNIIEQGTHEELLLKQGVYYNLYVEPYRNNDENSVRSGK